MLVQAFKEMSRGRLDTIVSDDDNNSNSLSVNNVSTPLDSITVGITNSSSHVGGWSGLESDDFARDSPFDNSAPKPQFQESDDFARDSLFDNSAPKPQFQESIATVQAAYARTKNNLRGGGGGGGGGAAKVVGLSGRRMAPIEVKSNCRGFDKADRPVAITEALKESLLRQRGGQY